MASSQISIPILFANSLDISILMEFVDDLSHLKFDGKGQRNILYYVVEFFHFFFLSRVYYEDILSRLLTLTLEGRVKQWCYSLPTSSIHSF